MKTLTKDSFRVNYHLLDRPDADKKCPIVIRSRQNSSKEITKFTGYKATVNEWSKKNNRYKSNADLNGNLNDLRDSLIGIYSDLLKKGLNPTLEDIWSYYKDSNHTQRPNGEGVIKWIDHYLQNSKDSFGKKKGVRTLRTNLEAWNDKITFGNLTTSIITGFVDWLNETGVANNSAYKRTRALTIVSKYAKTFVDVNIEIFTYEFPYTTKNGTPPRLTFDEVKKVIHTEAASGIEATAKDVFLLACFTGLRISDILTINDAELGQFHFDKVQKKTGVIVSPTLHKYNEDLVRKYHATGINYSRQRLSDAIYEVFKRAGIDTTYLKVKWVGAKHTSEKRNKVDDMAFHVGRRFYSRLLNDLGLGMEIARDELGHSASSVTEHYAGSPEHRFRIGRVREAMKKMEKTMKEISLMKVA